MANVAGMAGRWFSWLELTKGRPADDQARANLAELARTVLDPLREAVKAPVRITSGFRTPEANEATDGARNSQHLTGEAADLKVNGWTSQQLAQIVYDLKLPVDQVIWYPPELGGHLHVSHRNDGRPQRGDFRKATSKHNATPWKPSATPGLA